MGLDFPIEVQASVRLWLWSDLGSITIVIVIQLQITAKKIIAIVIVVVFVWKSNQNKYSALARLASVYLSIPASSAPVERIFSLSGKIF